MVWEGSSPLLPTAHRRSRNASTGSFPETHAPDQPSSPRTRFKEREKAAAARLSRPLSNRQRAFKRLPALLALLGAGFLLGYYAQLLLFFCHVRLGFTAEVLSTTEVTLVEKLTASLIEHTQRVVFVCKKTNWDFIGFIASPHTILFAHDDVDVPSALEDTLRVVRHSGVDSYMNLHNKTVTIMSHVHAADSRNHLLKQDEEAVIYWPHYYQCLKKCTDLDSCYAGDMHVNIGDVKNTNSYVFATGGSYFVGSALLKCMLEKPIFVELDGLDYGEDKTVGKMIHYNKCKVQYVSCKWFNNEEVYSPNVHIKMKKGFSAQIHEDTVLLGKDEAPPKTKVTSKLSTQYAFVSQRGYYPDALDKPNQDSCTILPAFMGDSAKMYFGVFDGHGTTGDLCASFVRKECPERLVRILDRKNCSFLEAYSKSFEETNARLHASRIDDSLSGTTAICMFMDGETIHVANVGDSRAVIATMSEGKLVAQPLSVDQTPYRSDERERVKRSGARVLTMDQLEGIAPVHDNWAANLNDQVDEDGDPPRIWSPYGAFPGTAFTRSLGDEIAETLGVIGVPEITSLQLTEDDRFVVIASDGVFEFLTSQAVVDMVAQYEDPLEACHKVVAESYRLWLTYELRTDDITVICVYFHFAEGAATASGMSLGASPRSNSRRLPHQTSEKDIVQQLRPVRRGMSKEKRRAQMRKDMAQLVKEEDLAYRVSDHAIPKSSTELRLLEALTKTNWLFRQLTQAQKDDIFAVMERITVQEGDMVIRQGDPGDKFYIVESGDYQVSVRGADGGPENIVHTYTQPPVAPGAMGTDFQPASFGELALMHNSPRSSSVKALSAGVLWAIDCRAFRRVFIKAPTPVLVQTLKKVDVLKTLNKAQLERLANNLTEVVYHDGDYIINQGDVGDTFYVIQEGAVICTIWEDDPAAGPGKKRTSREVLRLKKNQYFGERALLNDAPRAANVISVGRTKLLQVGRREFEEVLGSLQDMIEADRQQREARHNFETAVKNLIFSPTAAGGRRNSLAMGPLRPQDMRFRYVLQPTDFGFLAIFQGVSDTRRFFTVNVFSLQQVAADRRGDEAARYVTTHKTIRLDTPLVPEMVASWRDDCALYLSFDTVMVTDLGAILADEPHGRFEKEETARMFAAQALLMLEYIHQAGYAYRNLSSENVMVDTRGYLQLHDFRHMKRLPDETRTYTICGTPEYMAPEMVSARGHTSSADIWSLGILIYEMLCGRTPFALSSSAANEDSKDSEERPTGGSSSKLSSSEGTSRLTNEKDVIMAVYSKISRHNKGALTFTRSDVSPDAMDLVQQLLDPFPDDRLGGQGIVDIGKGGSVIRAHPWFDGIDWVVLASKTVDREYAGPLAKLLDEQLATAGTGAEMPVLEPTPHGSADLDWLENF
ncbi:WD repeat-containing protein 63 [Phytophthora boehmeriae]|uniref:protein-serine/threonine phosphatase n=1 Tax=Phytophthora boehmeriae TaxID=109152 RepID=A0A8T1X3Z0_9STRA|nr:WD repeat-containing protein 63 [Phytophthora boehmeriae]